MKSREAMIRMSVLAALALALPMSLLAGTPSSTGRSQTVQVSDLDLATPNGQQRLGRRVLAALNYVCPAPASLSQRSSAALKAMRECRTSALADVRQQLSDAGIVPSQQLTRLD